MMRRKYDDSNICLLLELMRGATIADWIMMSRFEELYKRCYIYDHITATARHPEVGEVPWPIIWAITRYHRKHIWCKRASPDVRRINDQVDQFANRVRWTWHYRHSESSLPSIFINRGKTQPFPHQTHPHLELWISRLRSEIRSSLEQAKSQGLANKRCINILPLTKWGLKLLDDSSWKVVPTDKDGGCTLVTAEDLRQVHMSILTSKSYETHGLYIDTNILIRQHNMIAYEIEKVEGERGLQRGICRSVQTEGATLESVLQTTCKTHKPAGKVVHRNVHNSQSYMFKGLGVWMARTLRQHIAHASHLLRDSEDFLEKLSSIDGHSTNWILRADVSDFFMSGPTYDLVEDTLEGIGRDRRGKITRTALTFLLEHQYITSPWFPGDTFHVVEGSGMGHIFSGEVADVALYNKAEKYWACRSSIQNIHGINSYLRFKDDLIIFGRTRNDLVTFAEGLQQRAGYFKIKIEEIVDKSSSCQFLDLEIFFSHGRWKARPYIKPSNLGIPLDPSSAHPVHVHRNWPKQMVNRFYKLSSEVAHAQEAQTLLANRLRTYHFPSYIVSEISDWRPPTLSTVRRRETQEATKWLVVPYHPAVSKLLPEVVKRFTHGDLAKTHLMIAFGANEVPFGVRVSWKSATSCHLNILMYGGDLGKVGGIP
jgi:hypothetical protein